MKSGVNVFLTGAPGSGKTYTLNKFIKEVEKLGKRVAVTASTGIAATHIKGLTIHSWSGLGIKDKLTNEDKAYLSVNETLLHRYRSTDILIIDEVSMLHGFRLDLVNELARLLRENNQPFGGIQIILVGDFFQLPPVSSYNDARDFVFYSQSWFDLDLRICYLTEQHRQEKNDQLLKFLSAMRENKIEQKHFDLIKNRVNYQEGGRKTITQLYSHNIDVDRINKQYLDELAGKLYIQEAKVKGNKYKTEQFLKNILAPQKLELKIGAEVMFVVNNFSEGYVNGTRGQVIDFEYEKPVVRLLNGKTIKVNDYTWTLEEDGNITAEVSQYPLRLAWAMTIHKSQGMSLDAAQIDLRRAFTPGMGYVALSRVRSLDGLYLKGFNEMTFKLYPQIYELDFRLKYFSSVIADKKDLQSIDTIDSISKQSALINNRLLEIIINWRDSRAIKDDRILFTLPDSILEIIASLQPNSLYQLSQVPNLKKNLIKQYGNDLIDLIRQYSLNAF